MPNHPRHRSFVLLLQYCLALLFLLGSSCLQAAEIQRKNLPAEARDTMQLIGQGGPFPYKRDGVVFGNFERRLPPKPRGYYHEYTVPTPGARNRGARRIVTGGTPPAEFYYSDDHYQSFRRIVD